MLDYFFLTAPQGDFSVTILPQFFSTFDWDQLSEIGQQSWKKALSKVAMLEG